MKHLEISLISILLFLLFGCNKPQEVLPVNNQSTIITGLSQTSGVPGVIFQIQGMHFDVTPSFNEVRLGQNVLNVISATENLLTVQLPSNSNIYGTFHVSVKIKGTTALSPIDFTIINLVPTASPNVTGYTDRTSYWPGEIIRVYLSLDVANANYTLGIYDINQNLIFPATVSIIHQVPTSGSPWSNGFGFNLTAEVTIPSTLNSGLYLIEKRIPFIVKPSQPVDIIVVYPSNTENAYCESGGKSLYSSSSRPSQVAFDRPMAFPNSNPTLNFSEYGFRWLKTQSDLSIGYVSDYDLEDYTNIADANLLILIGHSEYWSKNARKNFDRFIEGGKDALILSGNTMWWQVRYSSDGSKLICYKDANDPIQDPLLKTITWSNASLGYSTISSIGADFDHGGYGLQADHGWNGYKITSPNSPLLQGTGLKKGDILKLPTVEYDGAVINGLDAEGFPILNTHQNNFYRMELIGFDKGYRNNETIGTFIVVQPLPSSGIIVNTGTTDWCSGNGMGGQDQVKIKTITRNAILKLLNNENVFSSNIGARGFTDN